ncbi:MAG: hypothetical protein NC931_05040, partial [Candidatus Omnitrophica bacterium]|nr:hypothetical protein [Candidatus Omnitrophota bacterium]
EYFSGEKIPPLSKDPETEEKLLKIVGKAVDTLCDMTRSVGFGPVIEEGRKYGNKIFIAGGIDLSQILSFLEMLKA